jgi:hypothetical protein
MSNVLEEIEERQDYLWTCMARQYGLHKKSGTNV